MYKKILLIDDDEDEQFFFREALKEINVSVKCFCAMTAEEGIRLLRHFSPDFIFLDMNMPILNGLECLEIIKKDDGLKEIPVILYSTGMDEHMFEDATRMGAFACIKKKSSIEELALILKDLLVYN